MHGRTTGTAGEWRRVGARFNYDHPVAWQRVLLQQADGRLAGDHDQCRSREGALLRHCKPRTCVGIETNVGGERQVNQGHNAQPRRFAFNDSGQRTKREAVDDHEGAGGQRREGRRRPGHGRGSRLREAALELDDGDRPAAAAKAFGHAPVVD